MPTLLSIAFATGSLSMTEARHSSPYEFPQAHCIELFPIKPHSQR